jgi:hypothetical protein
MVQRQGMEFVQVDDLIDSDLTDALEGMLVFVCDIIVADCIILGVSAIVHVASPLPGKESVQRTLDVSFFRSHPRRIYHLTSPNRVQKKQRSTSSVKLSRRGSRKLWSQALLATL